MREILYYCEHCEAETWILDEGQVDEVLRCPDCLMWSAHEYLVGA